DDHPAGIEVDLQHALVDIGNQALPVVDTASHRTHHKDVVGAGFQQPLYLTQQLLATGEGGNHPQAWQLVPVHRPFLGGWKHLCRDVNLTLAVEPGILAVVQAAKVGDKALGDGAKLIHLQPLPAGGCLYPPRLIVKQIALWVREGVNLQPALDAVDCRNLAGNHQIVGAFRRLGGTHKRTRQADQACRRPASLTSWAARSEGWAPWPSQKLTRSRSTRRRSSLPRATGLKKPRRSIKPPVAAARLSDTVMW